jgi:sugar/nucleoside kinase (ribokinase family)
VCPPPPPDAFRAAFAVALLEGQSPAAALRLAAAAAAFAVSRLGASEALPTRRELERYLAEMGELAG